MSVVSLSFHQFCQAKNAPRRLNKRRFCSYTLLRVLAFLALSTVVMVRQANEITLQQHGFRHISSQEQEQQQHLQGDVPTTSVQQEGISTYVPVVDVATSWEKENLIIEEAVTELGSSFNKPAEGLLLESLPQQEQQQKQQQQQQQHQQQSLLHATTTKNPKKTKTVSKQMKTHRDFTISQRAVVVFESLEEHQPSTVLRKYVFPPAVKQSTQQQQRQQQKQQTTKNRKAATPPVAGPLESKTSFSKKSQVRGHVKKQYQGSTKTTITESLPILKSPEQQGRLSPKQIEQLLESGTLNHSQVSLLFPKPRNDDYNITSVYSRSAWIRLRNLFLGRKKVVMAANGGSSSTGCPNTTLQDRFYSLLAQSFHNVTAVDCSHGARNGMHSVQLMHSFLPMHTDVILWEFSINDATYFQFTLNQTMKMVEARNQLILWLDQVARVAKQRKQAKPPLVILVYLWNQNHFVDGSVWPHYITIPHLDFQATQGVAENYDFVVGHVNVGRYFDTLWKGNVTQKHFMADASHPNTLTHQVIYHLLYDLVMDKQRKERSKDTTALRPSYTWICGTETPQKRLLRKLIESRYPIASFTKEEPKNEVLLPGMLSPLISEKDLKIQNLGKTNSLRSDRKFAITIPCCSATSMMRFDNIRKQGLLQGIQLALFPNSSGLTVFFDSDNVTDKLIDCSNPAEWKCIFSDTYKVFYYWIVLETERNVSSIALCNHKLTCGRNTSQDLSVQSMTLYGET